MDKNTHSPGPWFVDIDGSHKTLIRSGHPTGGRRVASAFIIGGQSVPEVYRRATAENEANARLIAAAPDLAAVAARAATQLEATARCINDEVFRAATLAVAAEIRAKLAAAGVEE